ncbi:MAG TPA: hypothetical protein VMU94_27635 [Streptosporangiaceae bacterium]|nr:hypothetical protein [Streptosporangiaceae bacterium]
MNPRTRRAALYAIGAIAMLASVNALAHSYAGLYDWAVHHRLSGWQAMSWPAEIDVFLAVGELALYVAYLDGWPTRQRVWPWATALVGLAVSVAGNVGHIAAGHGQPVILADRLTAATSPVAAFAGLAIGLLVLKMTRGQAGARPGAGASRPALVLAAAPGSAGSVRGPVYEYRPRSGHAAGREAPGTAGTEGPDARLIRDARAICAEAVARGERVSQRALARQLRRRGHRFPNDQLRRIAEATRSRPARAA